MNINELPIDAAVSKYIDIVQFPLSHPEIIPSLLPIMMGLIVVAIYYGRYRYEELGWGAAVSNSLLLMSTGAALVYQLAPEKQAVDYLMTQLSAGLQTVLTQDIAASTVDPRFAVAAAIIGFGGLLVLLDFYHLMPKALAFNVSSGFVVYTLTYIAIAVIYEEMHLVDSTYMAAGGVLISFFLFVRLLKTFGKSFREG